MRGGMHFKAESNVIVMSDGEVATVVSFTGIEQLHDPAAVLNLIVSRFHNAVDSIAEFYSKNSKPKKANLISDPQDPEFLYTIIDDDDVMWSAVPTALPSAFVDWVRTDGAAAVAAAPQGPTHRSAETTLDRR